LHSNTGLLARTCSPTRRRLYETALEGPRDDSPTGGERSSPESARYREAALELVGRLRPHDGPWGTINILGLDDAGELVVGVSTSGFPWKYPGRLGDSPLPGAGLYCDARYGGAACTGRGEMTMRVLGAKSVVDHLARGDEPVAACRAMLADVATLSDEFASDVRTLCLTPAGVHAGASRRPGATYNAMSVNDDEPVIVPATLA
jgi:isoaspartyl peptidase/L-asparaginase-like protein (Ntn-hydrolase superfamily)